MKTKREKFLYSLVAKWVGKHFLCFKTEINKGLRYSKVDVIGVRDVGGELSGEIQTIAVEVKKKGQPFATTSGQTLGYNVYANRVYLAEEREKPFLPDQMDIASHLGIGLIHIRDGRCVEILSSPFYTPITRLNLGLLEALGLGRCQFCSSFFETGSAKNLRSNVTERLDTYHAIAKAIEEGKGLMFWGWEVAERKRKAGLTKTAKDFTKEHRFICPECVTGILAIDEKRIRGWVKDFGHGHGD